MKTPVTIGAAKWTFVATILSAVIGLGGTAGTVTATLLDDPPSDCSTMVARVDKLSPELKAVYAKPGPPPAGVPVLATKKEIEDCRGDPEKLLEAQAKSQQPPR
jgi:hypothetical protein